MPSTIRQATDEDRKLARTMVEALFFGTSREVVEMAEKKHGLLYIANRDKDYASVLMPSGNVLVLDLRQAGFQLDSELPRILSESRYTGDLTPNGELSNAIGYARLIRQEFPIA